MNRVLLPLAALLLAPVLVAAPVPKSLTKKTDDGSEIHGLWTRTPNDKSGWYFNPDGTAGMGDPVTRSGCKAIYKVDATQSPKHLDWSQDEGKTWYLAIYEVEGDVLRINFGGNNTGKRPTAIGPNTGTQFETGTRNPSYDPK